MRTGWINAFFAAALITAAVGAIFAPGGLATDLIYIVKKCKVWQQDTATIFGITYKCTEWKPDVPQP